MCVWWDETKKSTKCLVTVLRLCPSQVDLSPSFYVRSPHGCERNLLTLMPPYLPWTTGLQSLLKMRYEWRGGGGQHEMFFLLWDWGTGCEDGVFLLLLLFFFLSFNSCHPALSSSHRPTPSPHPLRRAKCCTGRYEHHHPCTPTQTHPPSVSLTTFVFTETLMAVFKTHCDV